MRPKDSRKSRNKVGTLLADLVSIMPTNGGAINIAIDNNISYINIPPSVFMACFPATDMNVKIQKKDFWDSKCTVFVAEIAIRENIIVRSYLQSTLPREAKYLAERR